MRCAWVTPVKIVGANQKPWSGISHGADHRSAPSASPTAGQLADAGELLGGVDGADVGVLVERVAEAQRRHAPLEPFEHLVVDALLHQQPRAGAAHVALVEEDAVDDALDRLVERGVGEHDVGGLAAELEGDLLVGCRRPSGRSARPTAVEPVNAILSMSGCSTSACPVGAGAGDDVDDAGRQLGLLADLGEQQRGERRGLGRLEHDGVAGRERRRDLPGQHHQREVPRDDLAGDAERLRVRAETGVAELVGPARVVEEPLRDERDVDVARLLDRLAVVERLQHRELAAALGDDAGDAVEVLGALASGHRGPDLLVGATGGLDRGVDVGLGGLGDLGQHLLGGRADRLERRARPVDELAVDEAARTSS